MININDNIKQVEHTIKNLTGKLNCFNMIKDYNKRYKGKNIYRYRFEPESINGLICENFKGFSCPNQGCNYLFLGTVLIKTEMIEEQDNKILIIKDEKTKGRYEIRDSGIDSYYTEKEEWHGKED